MTAMTKSDEPKSDEPKGDEPKGDGEAGKAEVFTPPNLLKIRASAPGGKTLEEMVESGNQVVSGLAKNYAEVATADISEIDGIAQAMRTAPDRADDFRPELMRAGLNLKGQAATMGYPLLTEVATSLTDFLDDLKKHKRRLADDPKTALPAVPLHVEALRLLMARDVKGRGGPTERALIDGLQRIVAKAIPEKSKPA
jgi:chemotaxis protein histidine kinase CheA